MMAPNVRSFQGYRIKQSADKPERFWIISESDGFPVQTGTDKKGKPVMWLEPSSFDDAEKWVSENLVPVLSPTLSESATATEVESNIIVTDFEAELPHKVSETMCVKCLTRFIDVRPIGVLLKDLECPTCGPGFIIETGEVL